MVRLILFFVLQPNQELYTYISKFYCEDKHKEILVSDIPLTNFVSPEFRVLLKNFYVFKCGGFLPNFGSDF